MASKSILSNERRCYICGSTVNLQKHHILYGTSNRKNSERWGCWCYLCAYHHTMSDEAVHFNHLLDLSLKQECQRAFEDQIGDSEMFMSIFGKNWL